MEFILGERYERTSHRLVFSVLMALFASVLAFFAISIVLFLVTIIGSKMTIIPIIAILISVCIAILVSYIYRTTFKTKEIGAIRAYKYSSIFFLLVAIGAAMYFSSHTLIALAEKYSKGFLKVSDNDYVVSTLGNLTQNSYKVLGNTVPGVILFFLLVVVGSLVIISILTLSYKDRLYIKNDKRYYYEDYAFSFYGDISSIEVVDYNLLKQYNVTSNNNFESEVRIFDVYTFGDYEKYFFIDTYELRFNKKGKLDIVNQEKSEVFEYDIAHFFSRDIAIKTENTESDEYVEESIEPVISVSTEEVYDVNYDAIIFDLDGVICHTDELHYRAWKNLADKLGIMFNRDINKKLLGVSRMESLDLILKNSPHEYSDEKKEKMAMYKNKLYVDSLKSLSAADVSEDVLLTLNTLKSQGYKLGIGSSSKNAKLILNQLELLNMFDAVSDGTNINNAKPDPEVFVSAADMLNVAHENCLVVEDAIAGIEAANNANMHSAAIGDACKSDESTYKLNKLSDILKIFNINY